MALQRLRAKIQYAPISSHFLVNDFTLTELLLVYGAILGRKLDLSNFRRDLLKQDLVVPVGTRAVRDPPRPPIAGIGKTRRRSSCPLDEIERPKEFDCIPDLVWSL